MNTRYGSIHRFTKLAVITLLVSFSSATLAVVWQEVQIKRLLNNQVSYHLSTIQSANNATNYLRRMEVEILQYISEPGLKLHTGSDQELLQQKAVKPLRTRKYLHQIQTNIDLALAVQKTYGNKKFERTLQKIQLEFDDLTRSKDTAALQKGDPGVARYLQQIRSLTLAFNQLDRLHLIAYTHTSQEIEAYRSQRNLIAIPAAIIILIGGFVVLRHLMSETRAALSNLAKSDQALQDLNQDLEQRVEQRTAELHEAQGSLLHNERLAALAEVTGSISHELRNPVGALQNALSSIKRISSNEDRFMIKSVALADRSVKRINHVIEELLDYSRVRELQLTSVRLDVWLADLLEEYKPPQPVKLRRELGSDVMIDLDQKRLTLAITNLLDNASQAIVARNVDRAVGSRSEISVTTQLVDDSVEITIDDTGPGIAPDDLEKVFEPLFTTKSTAIGLGLVITRQIIDQHNGAITIESEQGHGARATVRLALGEPQQIAANTAA